MRLRKVFEILGERPTGEHCNGMEGVIEEGEGCPGEDLKQVLPLIPGSIGAALRTEHYEIAGYTATITMAKILGLKDVVSLLTENLNEELTAAKKVLAAAQPILRESAKQPEEAKKPKSGKKNTRLKRAGKMKRKLLPA